MADHSPAGPVPTGADMDYPEHERTYAMFLHLAKYGSLVSIATLIAMAFGFFAGGGFISSIIVFILVVLVGWYLLR